MESPNVEKEETLATWPGMVVTSTREKFNTDLEVVTGVAGGRNLYPLQLPQILRSLLSAPKNKVWLGIIIKNDKNKISKKVK